MTDIREWIVNGECKRKAGVNDKYRKVPCDLPYNACHGCPYDKQKAKKK